MTFTVLGAVAELKRSLIAERVRAGLRGMPGLGASGWAGPVSPWMPAPRIARLRFQGRSIREIAYEMRCSRSLVPKTLAKGASSAVENSAAQRVSLSVHKTVVC